MPPGSDGDSGRERDLESISDGDGDFGPEPTFELREHTADIGVAASGRTLEGVFAALADGLAAASCDSIPETGGERFDLSVGAESREALLFEYLDELIYLRDVRLELPVDNEVSIDGPRDRSHERGQGRDRDGGRSGDRNEDSDQTGDEDREWALEGSARGLPLSAIDAREIKAVTYSEMRLEESDEGWEAYVVFDV